MREYFFFKLMLYFFLLSATTSLIIGMSAEDHELAALGLILLIFTIFFASLQEASKYAI